MIGIKFTNNFSAPIAANISSSATTIALATGYGALLPNYGVDEYEYITLVDSANHIEIVKVTARSGDTLTATRAQDNTVARAWTAGDRMSSRPCAAAMYDALQVNAAKADAVHSHDAEDVVFTPAGSVAATNLQAAIVELDGDIAGKQAALGYTAAQAGANSNITSLTGLTTPLSVAQGGTGLSSSGASGNVITSNGSAWVSSSLSISNLLRVTRYSTAGSGTWTKPSDVGRVFIVAVGGGGGGGGNVGGYAAGGASGGLSEIFISSPSASYAYTVGAAGAAGNATNGGTGGTTTIAGLSVTGGGGGLSDGTGNLPIAGIGSGGDFNATGESGWPAAGGGVPLGGHGGSTRFGAGGTPGRATGNAATAGQFGGGGGGAGAAALGGAGGAGYIEIWEYA
jgi:hypothetical protein